MWVTNRAGGNGVKYYREGCQILLVIMTGRERRRGSL